MQFSEVPPSEAIAVSATQAGIQSALESRFAHDLRFTHYDMIKDGNSSGRLFLQEQQGEAVALPARLGYHLVNIAAELMAYIPEARYEAPQPGERKKGWELKKTTINGKDAIIAWATWV